MLTETEVFSKLQVPAHVDNIMSIDEGKSFFIPIEILEGLLDEFCYSTRNFSYQIFKDGYANLCVAASLELIINYKSDSGIENIQRTFVGACNFPLNSLGANQHFLATAKSECKKNAASDMGKWFGRGLNALSEIPEAKDLGIKSVVKSKPDVKIMKQFEVAIKNGDKAAISLLTNIYDIKNEKEVDDVAEK
jgi:hypothetical protein